MKGRIALFVTSILLACSMVTGLATAAFFFGQDSASDMIYGHIGVDDIRENYILEGDDGYQYYNVYFFSQPRAATADEPTQYVVPAGNSGIWYYVSDSSRDRDSNGQERYLYYKGLTWTGYITFNNYMTGRYGDYDGYWNDFSGSGNGENKRNGYKTLRNIYRSLTVDDINTVGVPLSTMQDPNPWGITFSGWTYSQDIAKNYGYGRQHNFMFFDSSRPLSYYDSLGVDGKPGQAGEKGIDGTLIGDGKLYLYPIYSSGKDYSQDGSFNSEWGVSASESDYANNADCLDSVVMRKRARSEYNNYNDLSTLQNNIGNLGLYNTEERWFSYASDPNNRNYYVANDIALTEEDLSSYYWLLNIASVCYFGRRIQWLGDWVPSSVGNANGGKNFFALTERGNYNVYVVLMTNYRNSLNHYSKFTDSITSSNITLPDDIQKIIDENRIAAYWDTGAQTYNSNVQSRALVFLERSYQPKLLGGTLMSMEYDSTSALNFHVMDDNSNDGNTNSSISSVSYEANNVYLTTEQNARRWNDGTNWYQDDVFAVVPDFDSGSMNYTVNAGKNLKIATAGTDYSSSSNLTFLKLDDSLCTPGYYDIQITMTFERSSDGMTGDLSSITVDAIPTSKDQLFVKIFNDNPTAYYTDEGTDQYFINHENADYSYFVNGSATISIGLDTIFTAKDGSNISLGEIIGTSGGLYSHVTNRYYGYDVFSNGFTLEKNFIFYINGGEK